MLLVGEVGEVDEPAPELLADAVSEQLDPGTLDGEGQVQAMGSQEVEIEHPGDPVVRRLERLVHGSPGHGVEVEPVLHAVQRSGLTPRLGPYRVVITLVERDEVGLQRGKLVTGQGHDVVHPELRNTKIDDFHVPAREPLPQPFLKVVRVGLVVRVPVPERR